MAIEMSTVGSLRISWLPGPPGAAEEGCDALRHEDAEDYAYIAEEGGDCHAFKDNLAQNACGFGSDSAANSDFMGAFADGDKHDVADSDYA